MRHVLVITREVPIEHNEAYRSHVGAWVAAVQAAGAHAWVFVDAEHPSRFTEFLEWSSAEADATTAVPGGEAGQALETVAPALTSTLLNEWPPQT